MKNLSKKKPTLKKKYDLELYPNGGKFMAAAPGLLKTAGGVGLATLGAGMTVASGGALTPIGASMVASGVGMAAGGVGETIHGVQDYNKEQELLAQNQNPQYAQSPYQIPQNFRDGGIQNSFNPNAEVEKQELIRMPNGGTEQVNGPSHENGGVPVNIPNGTQIFSDRLKMPGTKKTFAKLAQKYNVDKQDKIINDSAASGISKDTAKLMVGIKQRKLDEIFNAQETLKQSRLNNYAKRIGINLNDSKFPNGGTKLPMYPNGIDDFQDPNSEQQQAIDKSLNDSFDKGTASIVSGYPSWLDQSTTFKPFDPSTMESQPYLNPNKGLNTGKPYSTDKGSFKASGKQTALAYGEKMPMNPDKVNRINQAGNFIGQNIGNIAYLKDQGKRYDKVDYGTISPTMLDPTQAYRNIDTQTRLANRLVKSNAGGGTGLTLSNMQGVNATAQNQKAQTAYEFSNANTGISNQFKGINQQYKVKGMEDQAANKGAALTNYYQSLGDVGSKIGGASKDYNVNKLNSDTLSFLKQNIDYFKRNPDKLAAYGVDSSIFKSLV